MISRTLNRVLASVVSLAIITNTSNAENIAAELAEATSALSTAKYELAYNLEQGEQIRYAVEHLATVDTKISGNRQKSNMTTKSTKVWVVKEVTDSNITFEYKVADVAMTQKEDGRDEVRYDSKKDKDPPVQFRMIAQTIGKPLATITINRHGNVIKRDRGSAAPDLGFGGPVVPLPSKAIKLGQTWSVPKTLRLRDKNKLVKVVKTQMKYRLEKVQAGVATISVKTEVLTPVDDAAIKSQLVQQLSNGTIRFDVDAGRVVSKQLDWTESVIGFNGPDSNMKYLARFTERLLEDQTARAGKKTRSR